MKRKFTLMDYIDIKGAPTVAAELGVSHASVCNWRRGDFAPSAMHAQKLIEQSNGVLSFDTIFTPYIEAQGKRKEEGKQLSFDLENS